MLLVLRTKRHSGVRLTIDHLRTIRYCTENPDEAEAS